MLDTSLFCRKSFSHFFSIQSINKNPKYDLYATKGHIFRLFNEEKRHPHCKLEHLTNFFSVHVWYTWYWLIHFFDIFLNNQYCVYSWYSNFYACYMIYVLLKTSLFVKLRCLVVDWWCGIFFLVWNLQFVVGWMVLFNSENTRPKSFSPFVFRCLSCKQKRRGVKRIANYMYWNCTFFFYFFVVVNVS